MPAFAYEYGLAKADGVRFEWLAQPVKIVAGPDGRAAGVQFIRTRLDDPKSRNAKLINVPGSEFVLSADMVVKALGQEPLLELTRAFPGLRAEGGKLHVDRATGATGVPKLFAGGDCIRGGGEIVDAVQDGKIAAAGINHLFTAEAQRNAEKT